MTRAMTLLVLAVFGHALLMTSSGDAAMGMPIARSSVSATAAGTFLEGAGHEPACFVVQAATQPSLAPLPPTERVWPPTDRFFWEMKPDVSECPPPHHPPDVLRALLQVYRI